MANILLSVRLSSRLAAVLDRAGEDLDCSPSELVEALLHGSEGYQKEFLQIAVEGPFSEKRNLRLSPEAMQKLRQLTGYREIGPGEFAYGIEPSVYIRSALSYFFSTPEAFQAVFRNAIGAEEWARLSEDEEEDIPRRAQISRGGTHGHPAGGSLILLLSLLVLLILGIAYLFKAPPVNQRTAPPPPPPSSAEGDQRLAGGADHGPESSPLEETRS